MTKNPPLSPEGLSPDAANAEWNYTLDDENNIITLNYYTGDKENVNVYDQYKVEGSDKIYTAKLLSNNRFKGSNYMFAGNTNIKTISFSSSLDTSSCTGMACMFKGCTNLESINFGTNFNTSNVTSMESMFMICPSLISVDVSGFDTSNVTNMNGMFDRCSSLANLDVSGFNTSNVNAMVGMFDGCSSLANLDVSGFDTSNVVHLYDMFNGCSLLESLDVSGFDTSNVIDMTRVFYNCSSLTDIDVSGFNTSNVAGMNSMFSGCSSLTSLKIEGFNTSNVTDMSYMFSNCSSLSSVDVSGFDTRKVTYMGNMFSGCSALTILDLTNFDTRMVAYMKYMFENCTNITEIKASSDKWVTDQAETVDMFNGCGVNEVSFVTQSASAASAGILPEAYAGALTTETIIQPGATVSSDSIDIEADDTSVNYGIGDSIPYKLTATMPESITAYKKYKLVFHDKLSAGLDYNRDSLKVFAGSTEIPAENYTAAYSEDGKSLTVSINDAKAAPWNAVPGTEISVKYSAVLNENAEVKNRNEAWLEYSNDPKGDGTGETGPGVPDTVDVYTFEIRFDKVDKNGDPLAGAGFTLYKKDEADVFQPFGEEVKGVTRFSFKGLAAGEYKLAETTTPDGYNTMEDFVFRIEAETADGTDGKIKRITMVPVSGGAGAWTAVAADKAFEADIANYTGSTLPSTGGMGTYAFYLAGAAVVITVGTMMTAKKKEGKE